MKVIFLEDTDSTNAEALRRWHHFPPDARHPFAIVADIQTAGRGRENRPWESPRGGLWFSLAWPMTQPASDYQAAPLVAGATLARHLEREFDLHPLLKWPNDIHVGGRKIAGILCQAETVKEGSVLIVGIGLNCNYSAAVLGKNLRHPATSLYDETGKATDLKRLAEDLAKSLGEALALYEHDGLAPWVRHLNEHLAYRDERITCEGADGAGTLEGRVEGVDKEGCLLLLVNGRIKHIRQGEITTISNV